MSAHLGPVGLWVHYRLGGHEKLACQKRRKKTWIINTLGAFEFGKKTTEKNWTEGKHQDDDLYEQVSACFESA